MRDSPLLVALADKTIAPAETKVKALDRDDGGPEVRGSAPLETLWTSHRPAQGGLGRTGSVWDTSRPKCGRSGVR
jgi:hypothetical protein